MARRNGSLTSIWDKYHAYITSILIYAVFTYFQVNTLSKDVEAGKNDMQAATKAAIEAQSMANKHFYDLTLETNKLIDKNLEFVKEVGRLAERVSKVEDAIQLRSEKLSSLETSLTELKTNFSQMRTDFKADFQELKQNLKAYSVGN